MTLGVLRKVFLSKNVYSNIANSVTEANNSYEIGGILLGYRIGSFYFLIATTVSKRISEKSKVSFILDGKEHMGYIQEILRQYWYKPSVLGVWHSHICDKAFSAQDKKSNQQLAEKWGGVLSMLVMQGEAPKQLRVTTVFVTARGQEHSCCTKILK